jgi:hypothetical protein
MSCNVVTVVIHEFNGLENDTAGSIGCQRYIEENERKGKVMRTHIMIVDGRPPHSNRFTMT